MDFKMTAFAGFDTSAYPGDDIMTWLRQNTNLVWCGYYLPAPSHPAVDWIGKLGFLKGLNWGIAPLYVGQEIIGPGSHHTNGPQGKIDGLNAAKIMKSEGFDPGSIVYLDLENGLPFPAAQKAYVQAWCAAVETSGYHPGVYCSHSFAEQVGQAVPRAMIWAFKVSTTSAHRVPGPHYPDPSPAGSGYTGAFVWQLGQHCMISVPMAHGGLLEVDLDSASTPNPSVPGTDLTTDAKVANLWTADPAMRAKDVAFDIPAARASPATAPARQKRRSRES